MADIGKLLQDYKVCRALLEDKLLEEIDCGCRSLARARDALAKGDFETVYGLLYCDALYTKPIVTRAIGPCVASVERDCIVLGNVSCTDHAGRVFEHYDELRVDRDIVRNPNGSQADFTPYRAAAHFESQGKFLPSFALSCNILKALHENKDDSEVSKMLMQYKDHGNGYGWHAQNTIVDWGGSKIIYYPCDSDFPKHGGSSNINKGKRIELAFNSKGFGNMPLEKALKNPNLKNYITDLTGLQQPETLIEIGKHFKKPAYAWASSSSEVCAAWLGCYYSDFVIDTYDSLSYSDAARGVSSQ